MKAKIKITFTQDTLATSPGNPQIMEKYLASLDNDKTREEMASVIYPEQLPPKDASPEVLEEFRQKMLTRTSTVFHRDENGIFIYDYQMKGYFKEKVFMLLELGRVPGLTKWSYKRAVDLFFYINPRRIYFQIPKEDGSLQRPLRADTMQGPRICLARSETVHAGRSLEFDIFTLVPNKGTKKSSAAAFDEDLIRECLHLGEHHGFSQWRSAGWGRFTHEMTVTQE